MTAQQISIRELFKNQEQFSGRTVQVSGWIRTIRDQKQFAFINLNDGTFFHNLQIILTREDLEDYDAIVRLGNGSAIIVTGTILLTPDARQPLEMKAIRIEVEGECPPDYPLQPKRHTPEFLRSIAHLRPRTNLLSAVFRVRSVAAYAIHRFLNERNFIYVHTPIITGSDAEGAGQMFSVTTLDLENPARDEEGKVDFSQDFFGKHTNLTVSGQLSGEAFAMAFKNIYTFGPTFRAEKSNTVKHAAEFWMVEPEIAFADLADNMRLAEAMIKYIISYVLTNCPEEMTFFNNFVDRGLLDRLQNVLDHDFGVMTYTEAIEALLQADVKFEYPVYWGCDLQTEHERFLTECLLKKPVFVIHYPKEIKAFYMKLNSDGKTVAAMDCLVPGIGEIVGGSQREDDYERLRQRMLAMGLDEKDYWWYLDLRKYGGTRHAGFGLGFERLIMYLTGVSNIRDVIPFPRTTGHAEF
ncbi:MAG: asparagine--tRNA ligase [Saccharofermentanales bacterium]|jgi:asparaginyl-tRNA synthetase|nr:asparagine--tRNA ligase [Clostridiaceae bacterium]